MAERIRRSKKEIIKDKIDKLNLKITGLQEKIAEIEKTKAELENELKELDNAALQAKREEEVKKIQTLLRKNNISYEELEKIISEK